MTILDSSSPLPQDRPVSAESRQAADKLAVERARLESVRRHLASKVDAPLWQMASACRATALLETDPERRAELAAVADGCDEEVRRIRELAMRAWTAVHCPAPEKRA